MDLATVCWWVAGFVAALIVLSALIESPNMSGWRRSAAAMWSAPSDPSFYGQVEMDMTDVLPILERLSKKHGVKVTPTHFCAWAISRAFARHPEANCRVILGGFVRRRKTFDLFLQVHTEEKGSAGLTGMKIANADKYDIVDIARLVHERADEIRIKKKDRTFPAALALGRLLPPPLFFIACVSCIVVRLSPSAALSGGVCGGNAEDGSADSSPASCSWT